MGKIVASKCIAATGLPRNLSISLYPSSQMSHLVVLARRVAAEITKYILTLSGMVPELWPECTCLLVFHITALSAASAR